MNNSITIRLKNISQDKKQLLTNFFSLGTLQIFSYVIPLITLPYLARVLGVEKFGLVFFAAAFIQYFGILTDFGFGLSAVRETAINRDNTGKISEIFNSVMLIKFCLLIVGFIIMSSIILFFPKFRADWLVYFYTFGSIAGVAFFPDWFFQGMGQMRYITILNITAKLIFLGLIFVFVKTSSNYLLVPVLNSLGYLVAGVIGFFLAIKQFKIKLYCPDFQVLKLQFKYSAEFFLSRVSVSLYTNTNAFCLGLLGSTLSVGYYVAAEKLYQAFGGIYQPLNNSLYPYVAKYKNIAFYKKFFKLAILINTITCLFLFIFAKWIILLLYGSQMLAAVNILKIFALIILFLTPSVMLGYPFLGALGHTKEANQSIVIGAFIHIFGLLTLYFFGKMSIYTIASMVFITEFIVFAIKVFAVKKYRLWNVSSTMEKGIKHFQ